MKKSKNTFSLNKQRVAYLDKELKNNLKGGTNTTQLDPTTTLETLLGFTCKDTFTDPTSQFGNGFTS